MKKEIEFPWDLLKAECLRLVCSQLVQGSSQGLNTYPNARKDEMIEFLRDVQAHSLDTAVKTLERRLRSPRKSISSKAAVSPGKRKQPPVSEESEEEGPEGYNTRYKGVKRVRVRAETPERTSRSHRKTNQPRKSVTTVADDSASQAGQRSTRNAELSVDATTSTISAKRGRGRPRKSVTASEAAATTAPAINGKENEAVSVSARPRGRPRKSDSAPTKVKVAKPAVDADRNPKRGRGRPRKSIPTAKPPSSKGKQVFDGVLLEKRKAKAHAIVDPEADADGEYEDEDAVLAAVNGNDADGASSLGGSNKENDPDEAFRYTTGANAGDHDADMDADGDPDGEPEPMQTVTAITATTITTI